MLIRRTLHEMGVYTHRVDMAEGSAGVTWVVCACKRNDLPDGDDTLYTEHVILWQGRLADYTTLGHWWVFETESEVNCGMIAWAVTKSRQDDRQQYTLKIGKIRCTVAMQLYPLRRRSVSSSIRAARLGNFHGKNRGGKFHWKSPKIHHVLVYTDKEGNPG